MEYLYTVFSLIISNILIFGAVLAFYLNYRKTGFEVVARYTISTTSLGLRLTNVIIENKKDKPIVIDAIYGVFNNDLWVELIKFDKLYILKSLDCVVFDIPLYSTIKVGGDNFQPDFFEGFSISIGVGGELKKCVASNYSTGKYDVRHVGKSYLKYNDVIYNGNIKYIFSYVCNGEHKTSLISSLGVFSHNWDFNDNRIYGELTVANVLNFLKEFQLEDLFSTYQIIEVPENIERENNTIVFTKKTNQLDA